MRAQFPGQEVVFHDNSPYGSLVVTKSAGQYNFVENGVALFSTENVEQVEETVHYAMAAAPARASRAAGGRGRQWHGPRDPQVQRPRGGLRRARSAGHPRRPSSSCPSVLADPRSTWRDRRAAVRAQSPHRYDVVIVDVPDPSTSQLNRFYTREFFAEAKRGLTAGGVLCISLGQYENYLSDELADLIAVTHRDAARAIPQRADAAGRQDLSSWPRTVR